MKKLKPFLLLILLFIRAVFGDSNKK